VGCRRISKVISHSNGADDSLLEYTKPALEALLSPYSQKLPIRVQRIYIQSIAKLFTSYINEITTFSHDRKLELEFILEQILKWLDPFTYSSDLEVQERSIGFSQIFTSISSEIQNTPVNEYTYQDEATQSWDSRSLSFPTVTLLTQLFGEIELNPVSAKAQRRVPIPDGLDLQTPLYTTNQLISWPDDNLDEPEIVKRVSTPLLSDRRKDVERSRDDPFYIGTSREEEDFDAIPIIHFEGETNLLAGPTKVKKKKKKAREIVLEEPVNIATDEMPDNATLSDNEVNGRKESKKGVNVLRNKVGKGLEDIDFEEEERLEKEAIEAERLARLNRSKKVEVQKTVTPEIEEPVLVERVKKKKKKVNDGESVKKVRKKKPKETVET
jgi:AP-3 complex subunit delta